MMVRCVYFILIGVALLISGAFAEEVDRPPEDLSADFLPKVPLTEPEPPSVEFDATRSVKTREQIRDEEARAKQAPVTAKILEKFKAELAKLKNPVLKLYAIENDGRDHERDPLRVAMHDPANGSFYGWKIITSTRLFPIEKIEFEEYISTPATYGWWAGACFFPGMALQWKDAERSVTAVLCLQCHWIKFELDGAIEVVPLSGKGVIEGYARFFECFPELMVGAKRISKEQWEEIELRIRK